MEVYQISFATNSSPCEIFSRFVVDDADDDDDPGDYQRPDVVFGNRLEDGHKSMRDLLKRSTSYSSIQTYFLQKA